MPSQKLVKLPIQKIYVWTIKSFATSFSKLKYILQTVISSNVPWTWA